MKQSASVSDTREFASPAQQQNKWGGTEKAEAHGEKNRRGKPSWGHLHWKLADCIRFFALLSENKDATA